MTKLPLRAWMFLRRNLWVRGFEELHVEAAFSLKAYVALEHYTSKHPGTFLMLTCPRQDLWHRMRIQADKVGEDDYEATVKARYLSLRKACGNPLGVHVHLFGPYSVDVPNYYAQFKMVSEAKQWFNKLGLPTEDFAAGWNRYNQTTVRVCEKLGFKRFHVSQVKNGCEESGKLQFRMVYNVAHDWGLK